MAFIHRYPFLCGVLLGLVIWSLGGAAIYRIAEIIP
jgi:hypothetical protein